MTTWASPSSTRVSGLMGGARQVEVSMHGIGERAGNAALEEVAAILQIRHDQYPFTATS